MYRPVRPARIGKAKRMTFFHENRFVELGASAYLVFVGAEIKAFSFETLCMSAFLALESASFS
jgi:hypothetical protein